MKTFSFAVGLRSLKRAISTSCRQFSTIAATTMNNIRFLYEI